MGRRHPSPLLPQLVPNLALAKRVRMMLQTKIILRHKRRKKKKRKVVGREERVLFASTCS